MNKQAKNHLNCECSIRWKMFKNGVNTPGLFCKKHNVFFDWLTVEVAYELLDSGAVQEELWVDKPKRKNIDARVLLG